MFATQELERPYERAFARSCGYATHGELVDASEPVMAVDGDLWYLTALPNGHWLAWPFPDLDDTHQFPSYDEAIEFLKPRVLV
jgi:hypothetical protein